ncbi:MAG: DUF4340 domain-containing protein [Verrucomicrobiota bacterium]
MNTKTTLLLLAAAGGIFGFIQLYEMKQPTTRETVGREQYMLLFDRNNISGISITSSQDKIELRKHGTGWELEAPLKDRADQGAVEQILTACETLRQDAGLVGKIADKKKLKDFGVAKSNLRIKLLGQDAPPELWFGKETAVEGKSYARLDGSNKVAVVSSDLKTLLTRKADELRDRHLADFEPARVTNLSLKTVDGEIALTKSHGHWGFTKPLKARADDATVDRLLTDLLGTGIVAFVQGQGANFSSYGLSEPRATLTFHTLIHDKPIMLEFGAGDEKTGNIYARISDRTAVYLLPKSLEPLLTLKPNQLRDRRLLRVDFDLVDRITVAPENKPRVVLQRKQEDWMLVDPSADSRQAANAAKIQVLVQTLQTRQISAFVADVASDLPKYGLDKPKLRLTFSSYASENTAESNAGEHPLLTASFGNTDGDKVYARIEDEPFVVAVDKSLVESISRDPVEWRALPVFQYKPGEITSLDVTTYSEGVPRPPVSLIRKGEAWVPAEGSAPRTLNSINVQSLINTLASLKAVRWTSSAPLITPSQTITFRDASGASRRLILGSPAEDQSCPAMIEGDPGVFTVSAPDSSGLRLQLAE